VTWLHKVEASFPLDDEAADVVCAFSVFTHLEHGDTYHHLADGLRVVRAGGRFMFSCLPLDLDVSRQLSKNRQPFRSRSAGAVSAT
jgi:hypothetical protein